MMFAIIPNAKGLTGGRGDVSAGRVCIAPSRMSYFVMTELHLVIVTHVYG